jgi:hypothetical protein
MANINLPAIIDINAEPLDAVKLTTDALMPIWGSCKDHLARLLMLLDLPGGSYWFGDAWRMSINISLKQMTGKSEFELEGPLSSEQDVELSRRTRDHVANPSSRDPNEIAARRRWCLHQVDQFAVQFGHGVDKGIHALFSVAIVHLWTAFETLAGDLWVAALNHHPYGLARLSGTRGRIEKKSAIARSVHESNKTDDPKVSLREIEIITKGRFDLSLHMGDLLRGNFRFSTLAGIREAYSAAFSETEKRWRTESLDKILADKSLDALASVRNLIVHRAGVADTEYVEAIRKGYAVPKLDLGQRLELDGETVRAFANATISSCTSLVIEVDKWLVHTGANADGERKNTADPEAGNAV